MSHILVVDDSLTQAAMYQRLIERAGHRFSHVETAEEAFKHCLDTTPDLVILDQYLGQDRGLEICQRLKNDIALQLIPVLMLTGSAKDRDHIQALEAGADAFLSKDSPNEELMAVVDRLLKTMLPVQSIERDAETRDAFLRGARILVVDDSQTYLHHICEALKKEDLQVTGLTSAEEALGLLDQQTFDVGVIDIIMPEIDGFEVCRQARGWADRNHKHLGLLVITGQENVELPMRSFEAGADDFVSKMQEMEIVVAHVKALVRRVRTMRHVNTINQRTHQHELALREAEWQREQAEERAQHADELKRSNEELERFGYVVSHDLQEPLRAVSSYCQLLRDAYEGKLDEQADAWIGHAVGGAKRMATLINDLLAYSRVRPQDDPAETADLNAAFDNAVANLQTAMEEAGAKVTCDQLPTLMVNQLQFSQLFQNLIGNAIKFRGDAAPEVHVSSEQRGEEWLFSVSDNGIGIADEQLTKVFEIFKRLHGRAEYTGTGIGLAICEKIVALHGGRIWVESELGKASVFNFTIPR